MSAYTVAGTAAGLRSALIDLEDALEDLRDLTDGPPVARDAVLDRADAAFKEAATKAEVIIRVTAKILEAAGR